jgi:large subunit ribosomal protein L29
VKIRELRDKTVDELCRLLTDKREELFKFRLKAMSGQEVKSNHARNIKKEIARILTLLGEKEKAV